MTDLTHMIGKEVGVICQQEQMTISFTGILTLADETYYQVASKNVLCTFTDLKIKKVFNLDDGKILISIGSQNV